MTLLTGFRKASASRPELPDCSLVVATYERPVAIVTLLAALNEMADPPGEVVVVDGSSGRDSERVVRDWSLTAESPFDLIYVHSPAGLTLQRNVGVDASAGAFVFFLDDDCVPHDGYFREIRRTFVEDASQQIGAVAGAIVNEMNRPLSGRWRTRLALRLAERGEPGSYLSSGVSVPASTVAPFTGLRHVQVVPGGAVAYRRQVLNECRFSLFFCGYAQGEDLEMSLRAGARWNLVWCGDAHVSHFHAVEGRPASVAKGRMEVRNRYFIWKRHAAPSVLDRFRFWADLGYGAAYDVASFASDPRSLSPLRHAWGVVSGIASCLTLPPRYIEPAAQREYDFALETIAPGSTSGRSVPAAPHTAA